MLTNSFYPKIGGVERHILMVAEELCRNGFEVQVATWRNSLQVPAQEKINSVEVYRLRRAGLFKTWFCSCLRHFVKLAQIIHCHDHYSFLRFYFPFRFLYPKKPVFITFHGYETYPIPKLAYLLRKIANSLCNGSIAVGKFITYWYNTKVDYIVYGGVDAKFYREEWQQDLATTPPLLSATFLGRLEPDTGIMGYLQAVKILKERHGIDLLLRVCGDGSLSSTIRAYGAENSLNLVLYGWVDEPAKILAASKFAFCSGYLSILEAMALKRLVFALSTDPVRKDYLLSLPDAEELMVIAEGPEQLAEILCEAIAEPQRYNEKVELAYQFATSQSWSKVADVYVKLYNKYLYACKRFK